MKSYFLKRAEEDTVVGDRYKVFTWSKLLLQGGDYMLMLNNFPSTQKTASVVTSGSALHSLPPIQTWSRVSDDCAF